MENMRLKMLNLPIPLLLCEKIFSYISIVKRLQLVNNILGKSTNLSQRSLDFWSNVKQVQSYQKMELPLSKNDYFYDRAIRKLSSEFIWIIINRDAFHFELYFTDLIDTYLLDRKACMKYSKIRSKKHTHPSFMYPYLTKHNDVVFEQYVFEYPHNVENLYFCIYDSKILQELYKLDNKLDNNLDSIGQSLWYCYQKISVEQHYPRDYYISTKPVFSTSLFYWNHDYYLYRNSFYNIRDLPKYIWQSIRNNTTPQLKKLNQFPPNIAYGSIKPSSFTLSYPNSHFLGTYQKYLEKYNVRVQENTPSHKFFWECFSKQFCKVIIS
jgi:hypothetical protein